MSDLHDTCVTEVDTVAERSRPRVVGEVIADRYELLSELGEGLSGKVYRARDLYVGADPEIVALKILHRELIGDRQLAGRFRREALILKRLTGAHLCRLLDTVDDDELLLFAMEYVDGPPLDVFLEGRGCLPEVEVIALGIQVAEALHSAHENGVIHRDLKPSNVLVDGGYRVQDGSFTRELVVRVVDFGLAKIVAGEGDGTMLTSHGMIFGTPDFMAPEQVAGESLDARSDVYALGVLLYSLAAGQLPFEHTGAVAMMTAHLSEPPRSLRDVARDGGVSVALDRVVMRALAKNPDERYPSARSFVEALREAAVELTDEELGTSIASDTERASSVIGTTMRSLREQVEATGRGGRVRVIVPELGDAPQPVREVAVARGSTRGVGAVGRAESSRFEHHGPPTRVAGTAGADGRAWILSALVVGFAAVAVGVWLGLR